MAARFIKISLGISLVILLVAAIGWGRIFPSRHSERIARQPALQTDIDSIVVWKKLRKMGVFKKHKQVKTYHISLGGHPVGAKHFKDDGKTPEGMYHIDGKNPGSKYHKALGVSYPSARDIAYARQAHKSTGGDVKIHGLPNDWAKEKLARIAADWTLGCIALKNNEIDELYEHCKVGTPILILP